MHLGSEMGDHAALPADGRAQYLHPPPQCLILRSGIRSAGDVRVDRFVQRKSYEMVAGERLYAHTAEAREC